MGEGWTEAGSLFQSPEGWGSGRRAACQTVAVSCVTVARASQPLGSSGQAHSDSTPRKPRGEEEVLFASLSVPPTSPISIPSLTAAYLTKLIIQALLVSLGRQKVTLPPLGRERQLHLLGGITRNPPEHT